MEWKIQSFPQKPSELLNAGSGISPPGVTGQLYQTMEWLKQNQENAKPKYL